MAASSSSVGFDRSRWSSVVPKTTYLETAPIFPVETVKIQRQKIQSLVKLALPSPYSEGGTTMYWANWTVQQAVVSPTCLKV